MSVGESASNNKSSGVSIKDALLRAGVMLVVFFALSLYLYLVQLAYDDASKCNAPFRKAILFSMTIFGAGLIWDVAKHLAFLKIDNLKIFVGSLGKAAIWGLLYIVSSGITYALTNVWSGWGTIFIMIPLFGTLVFCALCITATTDAINSALE